jgi:VWFA-related protein
MKHRTRSLAAATVAAIALFTGLQAQAPQGQPVPAQGQAGQQQEQQPPQEPQQQEQQPAPGQPTFRTGINFVRVDVIVSDRSGNPVTDLLQADFEVFEDGKPQAIETFRLVKIDTSAPVETTRSIRSRSDEEAAAADDNARIFVFFLDDYHVRLGNSMAARKPIIEFIQNNLAPSDLVGIMYPLTPLSEVQLTRDHQAVMRAIERFEGRKFNYEPRNSIEERYALYPAEVVERIRRQVTMSALEGLSIKLGALREGRKAIIFVSEGFTALLPPQLRDPIASMPGMGNPNRRNPMAGMGNVNEERAEFFGQVDIHQELREVFNAANRNNTAIYAVDPRGLATGEFDIDENVNITRSNESLRQTQDTLRVLADETDGRAIVNRNDLARAMKQIVTDSSAYYLIGYNSSQAPTDGKFHEIRVRVKRSGMQVRARKGYWALTAAEATNATAKPKPGPPPAVNRALASIAEPSRGRLIRTWVGTEPGEDGKTRVTFVWEPVPTPPGVQREQAASVALTAMAPDGETYFSGKVGANGGDGNGNGNGPDTAASGPGSVTFEAPPGKIQLRVAIAGPNERLLDNDDRELVVPDLTSPELVLPTPKVYAARNGIEYQSIRKDPNAVPTAAREFRRTQRLIVRATPIAAGGAPVTVTSRLLNRQGQKMVDLPVADPPAGQPHVIDLPLSSLPPGQYLLEVSASAEGQQAKTELVAFRVEG